MERVSEISSHSDAPVGAITDVPGVRVGHATALEARTGVTVALFERGAKGAGLLLGSAGSTRGFESLYPRGTPKLVHGVCFAGGSTFGLSAAGGVQRYLAERKLGLPVDDLFIPLVPSAIVFDLHVGKRDAYPDEAMGYQACVNAGAEVAEGNVGAGTGAVVGKLLHSAHGMAGGVGTASARMGGATMGALAVVNAFGDVRDPETGRIVAGARTAPDSLELLDSVAAMRRGVVRTGPGEMTNTTLVLIVTDAALDPITCGAVARVAASGFAHAIAPVFTHFDGDVIIVLSTGNQVLHPLTASQMAADLTARAIVRGVRAARPIGARPCAADLAAAAARQP
jgi:L-aminopeptidase/D-esterase-like protein